jgi:hypothetical protein
LSLLDLICNSRAVKFFAQLSSLAFASAS